MKPRVFVGSSSESLPVAYAIQENLEYDAEITVWGQGIFAPSKYNLESLAKASGEFDFAIFVFMGDDMVTLRDNEVLTARDNVVFELGLFIGSLGRERCFIVQPRGIESLHLPTDLLGLTPVTFNPDRSDGNVVAALGPACNRIRSAIRDQTGGAPPPSGTKGASAKSVRSSQHIEARRSNTEPITKDSLTAWVEKRFPGQAVARNDQQLRQVLEHLGTRDYLVYDSIEELDQALVRTEAKRNRLAEVSQPHSGLDQVVRAMAIEHSEYIPVAFPEKPSKFISVLQE